MSLQRKTIRLEYKETVVRANTVAGKNVFTNRTNKVWQENLPAINMYPISEVNGELFEDAPLRMKKNLQLVFEFMVSGRNEDEATDKLDLVMDQVEQAILYRLSYDKEFRCLHDEVSFSSGDFEFEEDGSKVNAAGRLQLNIVYFTDVRQPKRLDDLATVDAGFKVSENDDTEVEVDNFSVPTI